MTKREARAWAKARRTELDMAAVGRGMAQALFSLPQWQSAWAVLAFAAMPDEPDTAEILRRALADGKRLLLPRVRSKTEMDWVEIPALRLLRPGAFGIQEPPADLPAADPAGYAAALALSRPKALLLDELPCDDWDARFAPEDILTEKGILR